MGVSVSNRKSAGVSSAEGRTQTVTSGERDIVNRVQVSAAAVQLKVEVRTGGAAGIAHLGDGIAPQLLLG